MKIERIKIQNFRVLHDVEIDLTGPAGYLAFINGDNGRGKTTFQSALRWCIYGEEPDSGNILSNFEKETHNSQTIEVLVEILYSEANGEQVRIKRRQFFESLGKGQAERIGQSEVIVSRQSAETGSLTDMVPNPEAWLSVKFPRKLENFFLFDGESMEKFFSANVRTSIEGAVREIAGVDFFESLSRRLLEIASKKNLKAARLTGTEAEDINRKLESAKKLGVTLKADLDTVRERLGKNNKRLVEIGQVLGSSEVTEADALRSDELTKEIQARRADLVSAENEFDTKLVKFGPHVLMWNSHTEVQKQVLLAQKEDRLPPPFDPERLQGLLEKGECICGCQLSEDTVGRTNIQGLIDKYSSSGEVGKLLQSTIAHLGKFRTSINAEVSGLNALNRLINQLREKIHALEAEKTVLTNRLANSDAESIRALGIEKRELERCIQDDNAEEASLIEQISKQAPKLERLSKEFDSATRGSAEAEILNKEASFATELANAASSIHEKALEKVRSDLETATSSRFNLVKGGRFVTKITEDFTVETLNQDGSKAELAAGEQMMKAYLFAIALREVINLNLPLIVDTPFGRLGEKYREELTKYLVDLTKNDGPQLRQVIFMMHDGEYTPYTKKHFASANPVELFFASEKGFEDSKSHLGFGIDPEWTKYTAWKDWADGAIK